MNHDPTYTDAAPVPPQEGTLRVDANGQEEIWWRGGWWSPRCLPADGAVCYVRACQERERDNNQEVA